MADSELDFEAAMRLLGVKPMDAAPKGRRTPVQKGRGTKDRRTPATGKSTRPSQPPRIVPTRGGPTPQDGRPKPSTESQQKVGGSGRSAGAASTPNLLPELAALRDEVARLKATLSETRSQLEQSEEAGEQHQAKAAEATRRAQQLEAVLNAGAGKEPGGLGGYLNALGVRGTAESRSLITALMESGRLEELLEALSPVEPSGFSAWLDNATALLGDCGECPNVGTRAVLRVPSARCEVCQGSDIRRESRKLVDACLNTGTTRLTIVGGAPKYHRQLRELVQHHRLKLRLVPGGTRRTRKQARDDIKGADLVVVWGPTQLDHATSDLYTDQSDLGKVVVVRVRGISSMLAQITSLVLESPT